MRKQEEITMANDTKMIGIDAGNEFYKTETAAGVFKYPAGYTVVDYKPEEDDNTVVIGIEDKWYVFDQRRGVDMDKCSNVRMGITSLPIICQNLIDAGVDVTRTQTVAIAAGIPIEYFDRDKKEYMKYYKTFSQDYFGTDVIKCNYKNTEFKIKIRQDAEGVFVLPQGISIWTAHAAELKAVYDYVFLIDIGSQTTDVTAVEDGKIVKTKCFSIDLGTNMLFRRINSRQKVVTKSDLVEKQIVRYITTGNINFGNQETKKYVISVIEDEIEQFVEDLKLKMKEHGVNSQIPVVLAGGGSILLKNKIINANAFEIAETDDEKPIIYDEFENARSFKACALKLRKILRKKMEGAGV